MDAVICDGGVAAKQCKDSPRLKVLREPAYTEHCAVAFQKGNAELASKVTKSMRKLYKSGSVKKMVKRYGDYGLDHSMWCLK